jgi:hypothetical protein
MQPANIPAYSPASSTTPRQVLRTHPLLAYFVLAYAFAWIAVTPDPARMGRRPPPTPAPRGWP